MCVHVFVFVFVFEYDIVRAVRSDSFPTPGKTMIAPSGAQGRDGCVPRPQQANLYAQHTHTRTLTVHVSALPSHIF